MKYRNQFLLLLGVVAVLIGLALWPHKKSPPTLTPPRPASEASQPAAVAPAPAKLQPAATQPESVPAQSAGVSPRRKFAAMGVLEANAIMDEIAKQDLPAIFQAMFDAKRVESDSRKQLAIQSVLTTALQAKTPTPEFLDQMRAFIANRSNSIFERQLLLGALRSAATKETVDLLIEIATTSSDPEMRKVGLGSVGNLGGAGEKLSPSLERVWRESDDQHLLIGAATAMAKIGTPSGIELLLSATLVTNEQDHFRSVTARQMLINEVYKSNAVPPLAARLSEQSPTSDAAKLVAPILVKIGDVTAAKAVVSWLQGTTDSAAPLIRDLIVQQTTNPEMFKAWAAALNPGLPFRNEQNREAIRAGLAEREAGIKHELR